MAESEGGDGVEGMDCSVGTIVWVRRRNGSWWPGRILGPHELSASHLMSPRSGTPVKLLGREDASVDWYNLEKSKRVKEFRCGEFDACIERAEASQGVPIKKREKYARREDAILHALELEKQQLEKQLRNTESSPNYMGNKFVGALKKESSSCSPLGIYSKNDEVVGHSRFVSVKQEPLSTVDLPLEAPNSGIPLYAQKGRNGKQLKWEDDNSEAVPRMRGLQDFGLRIAPSKKKLTNPCDSLQKLVSIDNHMHALSGSEYKRKRSQGGLVEESLVKRRDRRRPLVQVLQSSAKLQASHPLMPDNGTASVMGQEEKDNMGTICRAKRSRCVYMPVDSNNWLDDGGYSSEHLQISPLECSNSGYQGFLAEENTTSASIEEDGADSYERNSLDEDVEQEEALFPGTSQNTGSRNSERYLIDGSSSIEVPEKFGYLNNDDKSLVLYKPHFDSREQSADTSADVGVSKWQMKGKRNIRNLSKKPMEVMDIKTSDSGAGKCNGSVYGTSYESKPFSFGMGRKRTSGQGFYHKSEDYVYDEDDFVEKDPDTDFAGFGQRRYSLISKAPLKVRENNGVNDSDEVSQIIALEGWEADGLSHASRRAYWEESDECFDPLYAGHINAEMEPMLVDVDLKVQASYQGARVPLVSLMSRLNGKAIVGHPIQIEILDDGSTDVLSRDATREDPIRNDGSAAPQPVWRTGRRTIMQRVPRPHPTPSALDGGEADPLPYPDFETRPALKLIKNSHRAMPAKLQKKLLKKVSLSNQKTRMLSSIATEPKRSGESGGSRRTKKTGSILDGLIKPEDSMPLVTCVPVKVVFSRILEAVGRPPSAAATHRVLTTGSMDGNPS